MLRKPIAWEDNIPAGYGPRCGGQFEQLQSANQRLGIVVALLWKLGFVLLYSVLWRAKEASWLLPASPLTLAGGMLALWLYDISLTILATVRFIARSGGAGLNGLTTRSAIRHG